MHLLLLGDPHCVGSTFGCAQMTLAHNDWLISFCCVRACVRAFLRCQLCCCFCCFCCSVDDIDQNISTTTVPDQNWPSSSRWQCRETRHGNIATLGCRQIPTKFLSTFCRTLTVLSAPFKMGPIISKRPAPTTHQHS